MSFLFQSYVLLDFTIVFSKSEQRSRDDWNRWTNSRSQTSKSKVNEFNHNENCCDEFDDSNHNKPNSYAKNKEGTNKNTDQSRKSHTRCGTSIANIR